MDGCDAHRTTKSVHVQYVFIRSIEQLVEQHHGKQEKRICPLFRFEEFQQSRCHPVPSHMNRTQNHVSSLFSASTRRCQLI